MAYEKNSPICSLFRFSSAAIGIAHMAGSALMLFAMCSLGIFLATVAGSMPQFGLLLMLVLLLVIWPSVHWAAFVVALVLIGFNQLSFRQAVAVTT